LFYKEHVLVLVNLKTTPLHREVVEALSWREIADIKIAKRDQLEGMKNIPPQKASSKPAPAVVAKKQEQRTSRAAEMRQFEETSKSSRRKGKGKKGDLRFRDPATPDLQEIAKFDKSLTRKMTAPPLSYTRPDLMKKKKATGQKFKATAQAARHVKLTARLQQYVDSLANPWGGTGSRNPVNYNPVPTMMSSTATTTNTVTSYQVAGTTTAEITLFGGHGNASSINAMDGPAYHAQLQAINVDNYAVGPLAVFDSLVPLTYNPTCGVVTTLTLGQYASVSNTVASLPLALQLLGGYDQTLPFTAASGNSGHTRWKLVSMGIRIINITALGNRTGDVTWVQPSNSDNPALQALGSVQTVFADLPSFTISQAANLGELKITWIPKPEDCAYWHCTSPATASVPVDVVNANLTDVGIRIWLNNPSTLAQNYSWQVTCNWELAGYNLLTLASPKALQPADKNTIEPMLEVMRFASNSASSAPGIAKTIVDTLSPIASEVGTAAIGQLGKLAGGALMALL
jgi:hypothetical protein